MKKVKLFLGLAVLFSVLFTSCDDAEEVVSGDDAGGETSAELVEDTVENLYAPQTTSYYPVYTTSGEFVKFSFSEGGTTTSADEWDIAFRGTTVLVNGGTYTGIYSSEPERTGDAAMLLVTGDYTDDIVDASDYELTQDAEGALALPSSTWYSYSEGVVTVEAGKVLVVKTHDGHYAKLQFVSYYKDLENEDGVYDNARYYTFNYTYNLVEGDTALE